MTDTKTNDAARLLGRKGGLKGGRARADKLSPKRRSAIARLGAEKANEAMAQLEPEKRRRLIMRKRTHSAYLAGRDARGKGKAGNPYPDQSFQSPLHRAWAFGWISAALEVPAVTFGRWRTTPRLATLGEAAREHEARLGA